MIYKFIGKSVVNLMILELVLGFYSAYALEKRRVS